MTQTGSVRIDFKADDFKKITHTNWNDFGDTQPARYNVHFAKPFSAPSTVLLSITGMDAVGEQSFHFSLVPIEISPAGFRVEVNVDRSNGINGMTVTWLAADA